MHAEITKCIMLLHDSKLYLRLWTLFYRSQTLQM